MSKDTYHNSEWDITFWFEDDTLMGESPVVEDIFVVEFFDLPFQQRMFDGIEAHFKVKLYHSDFAWKKK